MSGGAEMSKSRARQGRLVLELRAGDKMVVNGAAIEFTARTSVVLSNRARFLFGKQLMSPEMATTPARRIYFAMQSAYVADSAERAGFVALARSLVADYMVTTMSGQIRVLLQSAMDDLEADRGWAALQSVRTLFVHDDAMLRVDLQ